jgi:hypothetical protein
MEGICVPMSHGTMDDIAEEAEPSSSQMDPGESMTSQGAHHIYQQEAHIVIDYALLDDDYKEVISYTEWYY